MTTSPRRSTLEPKAKRVFERPSSRSSLVLAELSYQRGDFGKALQLLNRMRVQTKSPAFKEENLYGCSLGLSLETEKAVKVFEKLSRKHKSTGLFYEKARFNLGLVFLFKDLVEVGDFTIARQMMDGKNLFGASGFSFKNMDESFDQAIQVWENLLPKSKHYRNIILAYLSFAYLLKGDLEKSLNRIQESLTHSRFFFVTHYVLGRLFLDFFFLGEDGIQFSLPESILDPVGIDREEATLDEDGRYLIPPDTYVRVAYEAFYDGFQQTPTSPELCLGLVISCFLVGDYEELYRYLSLAESMIPESKTLLDTVYWLVRESYAPPEEIKKVLNRLFKLDSKGNTRDVFNVIAPYFLL